MATQIDGVVTCNYRFEISPELGDHLKGICLCVEITTGYSDDGMMLHVRAKRTRTSERVCMVLTAHMVSCYRLIVRKSG